eukprot:7963320-Lingulodinium_polyedra.AAC.1
MPSYVGLVESLGARHCKAMEFVVSVTDAKLSLTFNHEQVAELFAEAKDLGVACAVPLNQAAARVDGLNPVRRPPQGKRAFSGAGIERGLDRAILPCGAFL